LKSDRVKRLKDLETENTRLRRAVSDPTLDKLILQEAAGETSSLFAVEQHGQLASDSHNRLLHAPVLADGQAPRLQRAFQRSRTPVSRTSAAS